MSDYYFIVNKNKAAMKKIYHLLKQTSVKIGDNIHQSTHSAKCNEFELQRMKSIGYEITSVQEVPSYSDFNRTIDRGCYVKVRLLDNGNWQIFDTICIKEPVDLGQAAYHLVNSFSFELIEIYRAGSMVDGYKTLNGAKKAIANKLNKAVK